MEENRRFTLLTFPQYFDGEKLKLHILFVPRNQNPLNPAIQAEAGIADSAAFADALPKFRLRLISGLKDFPMNVSAAREMDATIAARDAGRSRSLYETLAAQFNIINLNGINNNTNVNAKDGHKAPDAIKKDEISRSVKKYLPLTYRQSFNFTSPRVRNAVIDDSYFCAMREAKKQPGFVPSSDVISWGKVFAHILRQPQLAREAGFIYETEVTIQAGDFEKGGWISAEIADGSDFFAQQAATEQLINSAADAEAIYNKGLFIKTYAARIPALKMTEARPLFAPLHFPVLYKKPGAATDPVVPGNFDDILVEAAKYDDGFAKILHSFQPRSQNFLQEESDGFHPKKETGIRLGWDDEQILVWYMRQLMEDESAGAAKRIDAPLGVSGYHIDVRKKGEAAWQSLNRVKNKQPLRLGNIDLPDVELELPYQVYPSQLDGDKNKPYWLPMYYANWQGKSMVLPDEEAREIYQLDGDVQPDAGTGVSAPPQNALAKTYEPVGLATPLAYGSIYDFRVRMCDPTGGGPLPVHEPVNGGENLVTTCHFKRYVAPDALRINNVPFNDDSALFTDDTIRIQRPLLGYPAVVFTQGYANPIPLLKQASNDLKGITAFGLADPDVQWAAITVEVQTLKMDNLLSVSGKEAYIKLYTTRRAFTGNLDDVLEVPVEYRDCNVLHFGDPANLGDLGVTEAELDNMNQIVLPTARYIRLTLRAVCSEKPGYYGLESDDEQYNTRYGTIRHIVLYQPSQNELNLFANTTPAERIKGILLQPDPPAPVFDGDFIGVFTGRPVDKLPDMIQRLANALGVENKGLSLVGKQGQRIHFGCSHHIRHTLSPDHSSITFASKADLMNHWLCCISLQVNRDWTWDAVEDRSFVVNRTKTFSKDAADGIPPETTEVGELEMKKTISFNALQKPDRDDTTLIFIDAVEPARGSKYPDLIELDYSIETMFKNDHAAQKDDPVNLSLQLPVTTNPAQLPKIASAGIALSPYKRNEKYSTTEARTRYLWIEFEEPVKDPNDDYFARVLAYAPDQLLSNNEPSLLKVTPDPALPIDPEYIRIITPGQPDDEAGINAMQIMERALDSETHFLLPLPPGLHHESPELFGFFTYEFRVGHNRIWSTAQGRFGRALRATGIQHPAPVLTCTVNRDEEILYVSAPYATTVFEGRNVTADPPRTEIWALLYAQVKQADGKDYRNVLLDEKNLDWRVTLSRRTKKERPLRNLGLEEKRKLKYVTLKNLGAGLNTEAIKSTLQIKDYQFINKDATRYGAALWTNAEVLEALNLYGLPADSPLSVLCVEMLPNITNIYDAVSNLDDRKASDLQNRMKTGPVAGRNSVQEEANKRLEAQYLREGPSPLSDELGHHRILRTSPLVEVPFICVVVE